MEIADGTQSNYTKQLLIELNFYPLTLTSEGEWVTYYKTKNSTMKVSMNQLELNEKSGSKRTKKITSKQELQY